MEELLIKNKFLEEENIKLKKELVGQLKRKKILYLKNKKQLKK